MKSPKNLTKRTFQRLQTLMLLLGISIAHAQQPVLTTSIDSTHLQIGNRTNLRLKLKPVGNCQIIFPLGVEKLTEDIEVISQTLDTTFDAKGKIQSIEQRMLIAGFRADTLWVPPIEIKVYERGNDEATIYTSDPIPIVITPVAIDTTSAIKDIADIAKEPYTFGEIFPIVAIFVGVIAFILTAIFLIRFIYRKRKNKEPLFVFRQKPPIPAHEEALEALEQLRKKHLWQEDRIKEYYSELTDIVRTYIGKRFSISATEMTSADICEMLTMLTKEDKPDVQLIAELEDMLCRADLVKFAKQQPLADEHERSMKQGVNFVSQTIPATEETTESETIP